MSTIYLGAILTKFCHGYLSIYGFHFGLCFYLPYSTLLIGIITDHTVFAVNVFNHLS